MIKTIKGTNGVTVNGGTSSFPFFNMNSYSGTSIAPGTVRYNGYNYNFEVYDGFAWLTLPSNHSTIELDQTTKEIIEWAKAKRAEEEYLKSEAEKNPTIKDLLNQRNDIDNKITMVKTLLTSCKNCDVGQV